MIANPEYEFVYKNEQTYATNFFRWRARNNQEKMLYGQEEYSFLEAKDVFDLMYSNKKVENSE